MSRDPKTTSMGIAVLVAAFALGVVSILGLVPALREKSVYLHAPALIISIFFSGVGLVLLKGLSKIPDASSARGSRNP